jgi:phage gp29-like protein
MTRSPTSSVAISDRRILDAQGRLYADAFAPPVDPLIRPDDPAVVYRDIPITAITGDWTIGGIRQALASHKVGMFAHSALLVDDAFGDDRVQATLGSRTGALFGQQVKHARAASDVNGECANAWRAQWQGFTAARPEDVGGRWAHQSVMTESKRWAIMMGFSISELLWDTTVTPWRVTLKPWHPQFVYYRWDIRKFVVNTSEGPVVAEPGSGKWFVHAPFGMYRGWIHGAIRAIADKWIIKQLAWRDRARFNERHGLPIIKCYVPAAGDARQKELFIQSMSTLGQEAVVGLPQNVDETGYDLELLEARDRGSATFRETIEDADRAIILTIKSQNLTTEVVEGSFAAARQHGGTEQVTLEFDDATFAQDFYEQVGRPYAMFNFGDPDMAPYSSWDVQPIEDRAAEAKTTLDASTALVALKAAGVPVDVHAYALKFKIPVGEAPTVASKIGTIYQYHIDSGVVTVNEVRKSLGLPERADGDVPTGPPATAATPEEAATAAIVLAPSRPFAERNAAFLADLKDYDARGLTFDLAVLAALHDVPVPSKKEI